MTIAPLECCGLKEIDDLHHWDGSERDFKEFLYSYASLYFKDDAFRPRQGALIFTYNGEGPFDYGKRFTALIEKLKLGTVYTIPPFINPNTDNRIITYVWVINKANFRRYVARIFMEKPTTRAFDSW